MLEPRRSSETRAAFRRAALEMAASDVAAHGWARLQMRSIALRLSVSRQTLYNAFGDKQGLAEALALDLLAEYLAEIDRAAASADGSRDRWRSIARACLERAAGDTLLTSMISGPDSPDFLPLLTSRAGPVVNRAVVHLTALTRRYEPDRDPRDVERAADAVTRLTISNILLMTQPAAAAAEIIAVVGEALLTPSVAHLR